MANEKLEANFSTLVMSVASTAAMSLGLVPNPQTGETARDKDMARFNIDLLVMLQQKTKGNLAAEERQFLDSVITDLQIKFVEKERA